MYTFPFNICYPVDSENEHLQGAAFERSSRLPSWNDLLAYLQ
ncbi:hypothetical protein CDAR_580481, partial [Caerostris darwini]